jgi:hypothetical protein
MDQKYLQTHRSGSKFSYVIRGFTPNKKYRVELGMAEVWEPNCERGKRIQKILIQNNLVMDNLDVYASAGCRKEFLAVFDGNQAIQAASSGTIKITMEAIVENAMLSTIKIEPASSNSPPPPPPPPPPSASASSTKIVIDAGSKDEKPILAQGQTWTFLSASDIKQGKTSLGTSDRAMLRSHRSAPILTYIIPNLVPRAKYKIDLGFAEVWRPNCSNGMRTMDITVNGSTKKSGLDVYRAAGGCEMAYVESYSDISADSQGRLVIELTATKENAMVSYIEITGVSSDRVFIDAGSSDENTSLISGTTRAYGSPSKTIGIPVEFRTHRWGSNFTYTLDGFSSSKTYFVSLGFSEIYSGSCADRTRRFRVKINGQTVESQLDVHRSVGCQKALIKTYEMKPNSQGKFEITFEAIANNAMVSSIEVKEK